ncbi:MAG: ATP-binding protein [Dorea sp.]|nr:ATP-binding protein [Dorea sp.]
MQDKLVYVGNSSKTGAYMALMSHRARCEMEQLAGKMEYMELAKTKNYERIFTESMVF